ncbi:hypothetical protein [Citrobacter phage CF1 DK-2017]|uniref:GntR-family transcriptional regulator n=1 Tax=Citrobacter phage CF1 DK-2017 TaxID=2267237 RepID=A0A1W6DY12_9CAUD|nr:hypothetical protein HOR74_gp66 [Citrobacter phage CF1 DK-2017]ARK07662.1 hypothetical protein [Citrobacter phage CF1 DK-2017]
MIAKNDLCNLLTAGNDYQVLNSTEDRYFIECDNGNRMWIKKCFFESEHLSNAKRIADEASALAERERIRDIVAEQVRNSCLPGGDIFKSMRGEMTVEIQDRAIAKSVDSVIENARFNALTDSDPNEYVKVLEQLREVLRVPEGENIVTHAKVVRALADALIGLQK